MSKNSNTKDGYLDDPSWDSLFEMADGYEEQYDDRYADQYADQYAAPFGEYDPVDGMVGDPADFYENHPQQSEPYHTPEEALKVLFGYDSFRPGQKSVIDSILSGRDAFAVMPTGAGKSVCYQIPAVLLPGITLVISPLISLMQDQVKALNQAGISAAFINSALSEKAFFETVKKARQGLYKIIYVAPERLLTDGFLNLAKELLENAQDTAEEDVW